MNLTTENSLLIGSILLFISLIAGKTSYKSGVPVLIFFLVIGMLAGSEGLGGIHFNNPKIAQFIGIISLNFILFSGGFDTNWKVVQPVLWQGVVLSTLGVLLTAGAVGTFVWAVTDFTIYEGLLLGSIVSSTDSAAVFSILRSKSLALKRNLRPILELESGSNDPMAYVLTIAFTGLVLTPETGLRSIVPLFFIQLSVGTALGLLFGRVGKYVINRIRLDYEGLYIVLVIAIMFFTFSFTDFVGGNGFLAIYLCAVYLGNQELMHKKKIIKSFDSFAWLMQIVLFLTLGLLVFPSEIVPVLGIGLVISVFLILVARPLSVWICLYFFKMRQRSRWFISWVGLRGAVPIVFATYPLIAGVEKAYMIFNIVFFISLTSVLIQGTSLSLVARLLRLTLPMKSKMQTPIDKLLYDSIKSSLTEVVVNRSSPAVDKKIVELGLPPTVHIAIVFRDGRYVIPHGSTVINEGDKLFVLTENQAALDLIAGCLGDCEDDASVEG